MMMILPSAPIIKCILTLSFFLNIVLAGLGLKTEEFSKAFRRLYFNAFLQIFNFGVVSSVVFGVSRGLVHVGAVAQSLADGMVVCASLPMTLNVVHVLTISAGGDEASAIFNAAFGNMVGVFLSPVLILGCLGVTSEIPKGTTMDFSVHCVYRVLSDVFR
jgi:sodium/bile acid cotransporter 7